MLRQPRDREVARTFLAVSMTIFTFQQWRYIETHDHDGIEKGSEYVCMCACGGEKTQTVPGILRFYKTRLYLVSFVYRQSVV